MIFPGFSGDIQRRVQLAESICTLIHRLAGGRLIDNRCNDAGNKIPVLANAPGDYRLDVQYVLSTVWSAYAEVIIVLDGNANEISQGVCAAFLKESVFAAVAGVCSVG